jgi:hypothetical protein
MALLIATARHCHDPCQHKGYLKGRPSPHCCSFQPIAFSFELIRRRKKKTGVGNWPETPVLFIIRRESLWVRIFEVQPPSSLHPPEYPNGAE